MKGREVAAEERGPTKEEREESPATREVHSKEEERRGE